MKTMYKLFSIGSVAALAACGTVSGAGQDVKDSWNYITGNNTPAQPPANIEYKDEHVNAPPVVEDVSPEVKKHHTGPLTVEQAQRRVDKAQRRLDKANADKAAAVDRKQAQDNKYNEKNADRKQAQDNAYNDKNASHHDLDMAQYNVSVAQHDLDKANAEWISSAPEDLATAQYNVSKAQHDLDQANSDWIAAAKGK